MLTVVNGILGALVGVTGGCAVFNVYSSLIVGAVGSFVANITPPLLDYWKVGDIESRDCNKGPHKDLQKKEKVPPMAPVGSFSVNDILRVDLRFRL